MMIVEIFMVASVNKKIHKKILLIHADWLKDNGYKKEYKNCLKQANDLKRTCVHAKPRASLCTLSHDLHQGGDSPGAFAPAGVRARKLWGLL
jgi:hypothetical protein